MIDADIPLTLSVARLRDYKRIERLCKRAVGLNDYVLLILRDVIRDKSLFLAWIGDQLVGMTRLGMCIDGNGWLSMARTDPKWRGKGVARFLQYELAKHAKARGARRMRLWTLSSNKPAINSCKKGGFSVVCEATHVSHEFRSKQSTHRPFNNVATSKTIPKPPFLLQMNGYLPYKRYFVRANSLLLDKLRRRHEMYSAEESTFVFTKPEVSFRRLSSSFTLLEGDPRKTLLLVLSKARSLRVDWVGGYLPYRRNMLEAASKNRFRIDKFVKRREKN
jgi:GNAT superfamily N-acetyltransferase